MHSWTVEQIFKKATERMDSDAMLIMALAQEVLGLRQQLEAMQPPKLIVHPQESKE